MPANIDPSKYIILTRHEFGFYFLLIAVAIFLVVVFILDRFYRQMMKIEIDEIVKRYRHYIEKLEERKSGHG